MDFVKIISSVSGSKTNQLQGTPLNGCFWNNSFTSCQNTKMIAKRFSSSSVGLLLEKAVRKNYGMFQPKTSMRKPFFSKSTSSSSKKEYLHILFPWKLRKTSRKKNKTLRKINRACFYEYFCKYIYLQISFKTIFFKMPLAD